jgi:hypothetical protein
MILRSRTLVLILVAAAIVALLILGTINHAAQEEPSPDAQPLTSSSQQPGDIPPTEHQPTSRTEQQPVSNDDPPAVEKPTATEQLGVQAAVQGFLQAYTSQSWTDDNALSWLERTYPHCTDGYAQELRSSFGNATGGEAWRETVETRQTRSPRIDQLTVTDVRDLSKGQALALVDYAITTIASDGRTVGIEEISRTVTLEQLDGAWFVSGFTSLTPGPSFHSPATPTAPATVPTVNQ